MGPRSLTLILSAVIAAAVPPSATPSAGGAAVLEAGYGKADITPPLGTPCALGIDDDLVRVLDPIYVRAVFLRRGEDRALILAADLIALTPGDIAGLAAAVERESGVPAARTIVLVTHTHQTANTRWETAAVLERSGLADRFSSVAYRDLLTRGFVKAAAGAVRSAAPVRVGYGEAKVERIASFRRVPTEPGKVMMRPSRPSPDLREKPEGPVDPRVRVAVFRAGDGSAIGIANYGCHPSAAGGDEGPYVSGDFAGRGLEMAEADRPGLRLLHLTAPCGDVNPGKYVTGDPLAPDDRKTDVEAMGRRYADSLLGAVAAADGWSDPDALVLARGPVSLPLQPGLPDEAEMERRVDDAVGIYRAARAAGRVEPGALRHVVHLGLTVRRSRDGRIPTEAAALRVGDVGFCFLPGEIMWRFGDVLRDRRGRPRLLTASCALDMTPGYVVPASYFPEGGYEPTATHLDPASYDILLEHAARLLGEAGVGKGSR